jgi:sec-independent protein translocase protein TatB
VINVPGPEKLILLFVIALIVLGPNRLPQAARTLGHLMGELRRMSGGLQDEVKEALADPKDALTAAVGDLRDEFGQLQTHLHGLTGGQDGSSTASELSDSPPAPSPTTAPDPQRSMAARGGQPGLPPAPDDPSLN